MNKTKKIKDNEWLKLAIIEYIKNNKDTRLNSIDIIHHFKLRVDITFIALKELEKELRVVRNDLFWEGWDGNHYYTLSKMII